MSDASRLDEAEITRRLGALPGWRRAEGRIMRVYLTRSWPASLLLANAIGPLAEAAWHHPELTVAFGSVTVRLTTHSAGGITEKDFALAGEIEALVDWPARPPSAGPLPTGRDA